ncbi:hypothetical protein AK812_SmicGene26847 [Symbiodinium microadriaticum]|uniref:Uncharacterized protein n=1 Tax=Symbiodinium microadriaticum TaxID=2951 RepID=A0A1Q9D8H6_SYMMI|nr:hypothetical protein AK812_SmicGene26847 [Symbiodinium microadriaticum]
MIRHGDMTGDLVATDHFDPKSSTKFKIRNSSTCLRRSAQIFQKLSRLPKKLVYATGASGYSPKKLVGYHYGRATCVILDDDSVKCWGRLFNGMQATGIEAFIGNAANQMGDNLPSADFGVGRTAVDIGVSAYAILDCSCVLSDIGVTDSKIGDDAFELGTSRSIFKDYSWFVYSKFAAVAPAETRPQKDFLRFLREDTTNDIGKSANQMGDYLPAIDVGAGRTVTDFAILDDGNLKCWGYANYGHLGHGDRHDRGGNDRKMATIPTVDLGTGLTVKKVFAGKQENLPRYSAMVNTRAS